MQDVPGTHLLVEELGEQVGQFEVGGVEGDDRRGLFAAARAVVRNRKEERRKTERILVIVV